MEQRASGSSPFNGSHEPCCLAAQVEDEQYQPNKKRELSLVLALCFAEFSESLRPKTSDTQFVPYSWICFLS